MHLAAGHESAHTCLEPMTASAALLILVGQPKELQDVQG